MSPATPFLILLAVLAGLLVIFFIDACYAEYQEWREWRERATTTEADDEWLARHNVAPLSHGVDRVPARRGRYQ